jgi:hypothetical protein
VACEKLHIQLNPAVLKHWLIFDLDFPMASLAWEHVNVAPPNWIAINRENQHAHYGYLLEVPVVTSASGRDRPLRYAAAVESAFRIKLRADPGYAGLVSKNPLSGAWLTLFHHDHQYSLDELAEWVTLTKASLTSIDSVGIGRNVKLFEVLRKWSYRMVLAYKDATASPHIWVSALLREAECMNARFETPLSAAEVRSVARSVAKWVWRRFDHDHFRQIQRKRALTRWEKPRAPSAEQIAPWDRLGISRRTYYYRKKEGLLSSHPHCTDAISDISALGPNPGDTSQDRAQGIPSQGDTVRRLTASIERSSANGAHAQLL